jgi:hypothetical protein
MTTSVDAVVLFSVGQVWRTSRGHLWHVVEITPAGQAVLRLGGYGRKQFQTTPPRMWSLYKPNTKINVVHSTSEPEVRSWTVFDEAPYRYGKPCTDAQLRQLAEGFGSELLDKPNK